MTSGPRAAPAARSTARARAEAPSARLGPERRTRPAELGWAVAAMAVTAVALVVPLLFTHRYFFYGDTQIGSFGQWYHLGTELRAGRWPLLDLQRWRAGNFAAEGQFGQWNPLVMLIGLAASFASNAVVFCTVLKFIVAAAASLGGFLLARSYSVRPEAAFVVGIALPLGGVTQYLDLTTWSTGLLVWALLPFTWWAIRRTMLHGANPFPALAFSYLLVTIGYVYGTIYLVLVFLACLVDGCLARDWRGVAKVVGLGLCAALLAVTVYLPGVLTAPVTTRGAWSVFNTSSLPVSLHDYAASVLPTGVVPASWGRRDVSPMGYIAWFLPLLAWVSPPRLRGTLRPLAGLLLVLAAMVMWTLGPTQVGPLRYPMRVMPVVVLCALVLTAVLVTRGVSRPGRRHLALSLLWVLAAAYVTASRALFAWHAQAVSLLLVCLSLTAVWFLFRSVGSGSGSWSRRVPAAVAATMCVASVGFVVVQHHYYPLPQSKERNMPAAVADYRKQLQGAVGDVFMVGAPVDAIQADASQTSDFLTASAWLVNEHPVQNTYTTIGYKTYNERYCITLIGGVCRGALKVLTSPEPTTGLPRVDLLSVSTLLLRRAQFSSATLDHPPAGWSVARSTPLSVTWTRDQPRPSAGGVVWTSAGTQVQTVSRDTRTVRLRVTAVAPGGGSVVLSRLDWPGYRVQGPARLSDRPVDGYLTTLELSPSSAGQVVTLHFDPPGWRLELASWLVSVVAALAWSVAALVLSLRRRRRDATRAGAQLPA